MSLHAYSWLNCFLPWLQFCTTRLQQAETASGSICCTVSQWWLRSRHTQGKSSNLQGTIAFTSFSFEYICIHCCLPLDRFCIKNTIHNFGLISYRWWPIPRKSLPCVTRLSSKANVDSLFTNVGALTQPRDLIKNELQGGGKEREKKVVILQRLCKVYWWFTYLMSNHELLRTTITGNFCMGKSPRTIKGRYYPPYWRTCMESLPFQNLRRLVRFFRHHFCCQWYLRRFVFHIYLSKSCCLFRGQRCTVILAEDKALQQERPAQWGRGPARQLLVFPPTPVFFTLINFPRKKKLWVSLVQGNSGWKPRVRRSYNSEPEVV